MLMKASAVHIRLEPLIWSAGRRLMSMRVAARRTTSTTPAATISVRLRPLSSLHFFLAVHDCPPGRWPGFPMASTLHRLASKRRSGRSRAHEVEATEEPLRRFGRLARRSTRGKSTRCYRGSGRLDAGTLLP